MRTGLSANGPALTGRHAIDTVDEQPFVGRHLRENRRRLCGGRNEERAGHIRLAVRGERRRSAWTTACFAFSSRLTAMNASLARASIR